MRQPSSAASGRCTLTHHATFLPLPHTRACTTPRSSLCPTLVLAPRHFFHGPLADACSHTTPLLLFAALMRRFPRHLRSLTATRMAKSTTMSSRFVKPPHQPPSSYESDPLHLPRPCLSIHPSICSHHCTPRHSYDHDALKPPRQPPSSCESDPLHLPHPSPYIHPSICSHRCTPRHSYDHDALKTRAHSHTHRSHRHITCIHPHVAASARTHVAARAHSHVTARDAVRVWRRWRCALLDSM
jgi:hypothetical protein